ncbi:MAG: hypothetical protein RJA52_673 [Bacteroidota bacterium]
MLQNKGIWLLFGLIIFLSSCKSSSKIIRNEEKTNNAATELIQILKDKQVNPEWINAKTKITYKSEKNTISGQGFIKMKIDSALLISIRKFSIEVAKLRIDKDSIYLLDRLNSTYIEESLLRSKEILGFSADFDLIQSIILGRLPNTILETSQIFKNKDDLNLIQKNSSSTVVAHVNPQNYHIHSLQYYDHIQGIQIWNALKNYDLQHNGNSFALNREFSLIVPTSDSLQIQITFLQVEWDQPTDLNISIPKSYSRAAY